MKSYSHKNSSDKKSSRKLIVKAVSKGELKYVPSEMQPKKGDYKARVEIVEGLEAWPDKQALEYTEDETRLILEEKHHQERKKTRRLYYSIAAAASLALLVSLGILLPRNIGLNKQVAQYKGQQIIADTIEVVDIRTDTVFLSDAWTPDLLKLDPDDIYKETAVTMGGGSGLWGKTTWPRLFVSEEDTFSFKLISEMSFRTVLKNSEFDTLYDDIIESDGGHVTITFPGLKAGVYFYVVYLIHRENVDEELIIQQALYIK